MKFYVPVFLCASLALAIPNPAMDSQAAAVEVSSADMIARDAGTRLTEREPKSKPKTSSNGNKTSIAALTLSPSRALELGAIGLGVMEIVRLWN